MSKYITFQELLPFGKMENGVLEIKESFVLEKDREDTSECIIVRLYSVYKGEAMPKISFDISVSGQSRTLYDSPIYNASGESQLTVKEWRVPPMLMPEMKMHFKGANPRGDNAIRA